VKIVRVTCLFILGTLVACSSAETDWKTADSQATVAAYQKFLTDHPNDSHAELARNKIHTLEDEQAWAQAGKTNTADSFRQYVQAQPNGVHLQEANDRITGFERADAWKTAQADATAATLQGFLAKYPQGPEADQARAQLQKLSAEQYRVQLASFREKAQAERARARLQTQYGKVLREVVVVPPGAQDKLNRVDSAPMTHDEAQSACTALKKEKQHCEVVKA
jgi:outer membrane protein assembly factor BamD (BamD/ComL family)